MLSDIIAWLRANRARLNFRYGSINFKIADGCLLDVEFTVQERSGKDFVIQRAGLDKDTIVCYNSSHN